MINVSLLYNLSFTIVVKIRSLTVTNFKYLMLRLRISKFLVQNDNARGHLLISDWAEKKEKFRHFYFHRGRVFCMKSISEDTLSFNGNFVR